LERTVPIIGLAMLAFVVWYGFRERGDVVVSAFDTHALIIVLVGSLAAIFMGSSAQVALRTFTSLAELLPLGSFARVTKKLEADRIALSSAWREGKRSTAVQLVEQSGSPELNSMLQLILTRAPEQSSAKTFFELKADALGRIQPAAHNWEMLSKLGPAFGMVGTITGMVALFRNMSSENLNIGASMSLALLATLYGVAFGAGIAGPVANRLNHLLDDRLGVLDACEKTVNEIVALGDR
jgi:flagellar motor component MotA